jgi:thiol-disulfide isomerase/thioredoxin
MRKVKQLPGATALFLATFFSAHLYGQSTAVATIDVKATASIDAIIHLPEFKNKVLVIDVWGVHCEPCLEEFPFNAALRDRFKNKPVEFVYLSLDYGHPDDKDRWSKMIKDRNLVGYNIFISMNTYSSIWEPIKNKISTESMYLIPHYIIVDTKSNILFPDAARPSTKEILYNQIQSILDKGGI